MRVLNSILLTIVVAGAVSGQSAQQYPEAPDVKVVKNSSRIRIRNFRQEEDPLNPTLEQGDRDRYRKDEQERLQGRLPPPGSKSEMMRNYPRRPIVEYFFEATIRNDGTKKIKRVIWEYVFFAHTTGREIGYRAFVNEVSVGQAKSAKVTGYLTTPIQRVAETEQEIKQSQRLRPTESHSVVFTNGAYDGKQQNRPFRNPGQPT
jgi:hypothetical protein